MDNEILIALGRLEGKVDALITRQAIHDEELDRHDKRLRDLEQSRAWLFGASAVIGAIAAFLVNMIGDING
jgi:hypothetical protein|tara:strand:+ start:1631 stop:1843 length:213 start_codon:yes stop_codon:yes gene_type:complete